MRVTIWTVLAGAISLVCTAAPGAERDEGRGERQCTDIQAYLIDRQPGGREVRAAPDPAAPVVGRIREPWTDGQSEWAVSFALRASQDGWLLIEGAGDDPALTESPPRPMYHGRGWIRGEGVSAGVQASQGFAEPRHSSDIIVRTRPNEMDFLTGIVACDGNWILGRWRGNEHRDYRFEPAALVSADPLILEAWVTGICNIQETSCDMAPGDRPEE